MQLKKPGIPGRNSVCGCGSGKKFKKCCRTQVLERVAGQDREFAKKLADQLLGEGKIKVNEKGVVEYVK